jgi:NAD(P)-dependent dehydrogenase (short-subunit alcohol dehydrogenase family)
VADKAALITGGSSGIGLAVARALGQDGYGITISARRPEKLAEAGAALRDEGLDVLDVPANMTNEEDIESMVAAHRERFGRIDVLMNNAGVGIGGMIEVLETKKLDMQLDVNLRAVYLTTQKAIPLLKESRGFLVNTASIAGKRPQGFLAAYSATKAAVIALTESSLKELAADGVRGTAICPGFVDTPMTDWVRDQVPAEEMIKPEDVAAIVLCLISLSPSCIVPEVMMIRPAELQAGGIV